MMTKDEYVELIAAGNEVFLPSVVEGKSLTGLLRINDDSSKWIEVLDNLIIRLSEEDGVFVSLDEIKEGLHFGAIPTWGLRSMCNDHAFKGIPSLYDEINDYIDRILRTGDLPNDESLISRYTRPIPVMIKGFNEDQDALATLAFLLSHDSVRSEDFIRGAEYLGIRSWTKITCKDVISLTVFSLYPMMDMVYINRMLSGMFLSDGDIGGDVGCLKSDYEDIITSITDGVECTWDIYGVISDVVWIRNLEFWKHGYIDKIDIEYWDGKFNLKSLIRGGLNHREALKSLYGSNRCVDAMSNREVVHVVETIIAGSGVHKPMASWLVDYQEALDNLGDDRANRIPHAWRRYIKTWEQYQWVLRHLPKLHGVNHVDVELDDGTVVKWQWHLHRILNLNADEWVKGRYTGYKRLYKAAAQKAREEGYTAMNELTVFPEFPGYIPSGVRYLGDSRALIREGREMQHCVGGYVNKCASGDSFIFHVDDDVDSPGATLELVHGDLVNFEVSELLGYDNSEPSDYIHLVVDVWMGMLNRNEDVGY